MELAALNTKQDYPPLLRGTTMKQVKGAMYSMKRLGSEKVCLWLSNLSSAPPLACYNGCWLRRRPTFWPIVLQTSTTDRTRSMSCGQALRTSELRLLGCGDLSSAVDGLEYAYFRFHTTLAYVSQSQTLSSQRLTTGTIPSMLWDDG